jgi:hypothetical protein
LNRDLVVNVLDRLGAAPGSYSVAPTGLTEEHTIERIQDIWEFSYRERGSKTQILAFQSEADACWWLLRRVLEDMLRSNRLRTGDPPPPDMSRISSRDTSRRSRSVKPQHMSVANLEVLATRLGLLKGLIGFGNDGPEYRISVFETPQGWTARSRDLGRLGQIEDRLLPTELEACWVAARWIVENIESLSGSC